MGPTPAPNIDQAGVSTAPRDDNRKLQAEQARKAMAQLQREREKYDTKVITEATLSCGDKRLVPSARVGQSMACLDCDGKMRQVVKSKQRRTMGKGFKGHA